MKYKHVRTPIFFLASLVFCHTLLAQKAEYSTNTNQESAFKTALNLQDKANAQNKKETRLQLTLISNSSAVDNSFYALFLNLDPLFSFSHERKSRKPYLTTYFRRQNIYFKQNFNNLSDDQTQSNVPYNEMKPAPYDKWLNTNIENVIHHNDYVDMPTLLPPFKNIINPPTGFFMIHKF